VPETYGIAPFSWQRLQSVLSEYPQIDRAALFGSRALGRARKGSDIDLVLEGAGVTAGLALDVSGRLNEREPIPYRFDVLCGNAIDSPELWDHVARVGVVIYRRA
jgi:predicted nucleotidyltransferase